LNRSELDDNTENLPDKDWVDSHRLRGDLSDSDAIWGFKETFNDVRKSRSVSNAFCFDGQQLTFYIAPQGLGAGYVDGQWLYCKTTLTVRGINVVTGEQTVLSTFDNFTSNEKGSDRYFTWTVPSRDTSFYSDYSLFGLYVIRLDVQYEYYQDAELTDIFAASIPSSAQSFLQLLIYSGARELIDVTDTNIDVVTITPNPEDTLEQIFVKTIFDAFSALNQNPLTDGQKRAIVADQIAVLFMSQHPVVVADAYPSPVVGFGMRSVISPRKVVESAITYSLRYPDIVEMVKDRLFGMLAAYERFNFVVDIKKIVDDFTQSAQVIRDPVRTVLIDSNDVLKDDLGVGGIAFNPYAVEVVNAEFIRDIPEPLVVTCPLYEELVDVGNIEITDAAGGELGPTDLSVKVAFEVLSGEAYVKQVRYVLFSEDHYYYDTYVDASGISRSHVFTLPDFIDNGNIVNAQIDIEDVNGGVTSFTAYVWVAGSSVNLPVLSDLRFYQRNDGSGVVDIFYNYIGVEEIDNSYLFVEFSVDSGVNWNC